MSAHTTSPYNIQTDNNVKGLWYVTNVHFVKKKDKIRIKNIKNEILEMENPESRRGGIVGELEMCRHVQKKPRENDGAVESKA